MAGKRLHSGGGGGGGDCRRLPSEAAAAGSKAPWLPSTCNGALDSTRQTHVRFFGNFARPGALERPATQLAAVACRRPCFCEPQPLAGQRKRGLGCRAADLGHSC